MPLDYVPGDDDEEKGGEEEAPAGGDADKEAVADTDKESESEDQGKQDDSPSEQDDSGESEEDEASAASDAAIKAKLLDILNERDGDVDGIVEEKISRGIEARETAAKAQVSAEAEAKDVLDLFTRAADSNEDEDDRAAAQGELGRRNVKARDQALAEEPVRKQALEDAARQFEGAYRDSMDAVLDELGLSDAAKALTDEEKVPLVPSKFVDRPTWARAVVRAVKSKDKTGSAGTAKAKAERRKGTAARAREGAGTTRLPKGQSGNDAESKGQSARDYILSGRD